MEKVCGEDLQPQRAPPRMYLKMFETTQRLCSYGGVDLCRFRWMGFCVFF